METRRRLRTNDANEENKYVPAKIAVGSKFGLLRDPRIVEKDAD
jgi:hypothetical protein